MLKTTNGHPSIIQGGMGVGVSGWALARAVSMAGQLGVVSGTALDTVLARRLQNGDPDGDMRRALATFPVPDVAQGVLDRYFVPGGIRNGSHYKAKPIFKVRPCEALLDLTVVANYAEVFLAKEGHDGVVGINLLEKIQLPTLASLFGAMLAGVDYVLMGAGIPRAIPGALDSLALLQPTELKIDVHGAPTSQDYSIRFDPSRYCRADQSALPRPQFLAIVSSSTLAMSLARKCTSKVDGFVVEGSSAGGHNAPPRGPMNLDELGQPIYGPRDLPDFEQFRELGLPFWLAGSFGGPEKLEEAIALGAKGIQVGTAFAFCEESGIDPELKSRVLEKVLGGGADVFTDPLASPTGFPFKVAEIPGTLADPKIAQDRERICDLGYLREVYRQKNGKIGYRCPAEPVEDYVAKGGDVEATVGRKCVCNGLLATIGLAQVREGGRAEPPLVTSGDEVNSLSRLVKAGKTSYRAEEVLAFLLGKELG